MIRHLCFVRLKCGSGKRKNIFVSCETDEHRQGGESLASTPHLLTSLNPGARPHLALWKKLEGSFYGIASRRRAMFWKLPRRSCSQGPDPVLYIV